MDPNNNRHFIGLSQSIINVIGTICVVRVLILETLKAKSTGNQQWKIHLLAVCPYAICRTEKPPLFSEKNKSFFQWDESIQATEQNIYPI